MAFEYSTETSKSPDRPLNSDSTKVIMAAGSISRNPRSIEIALNKAIFGDTPKEVVIIPDGLEAESDGDVRALEEFAANYATAIDSLTPDEKSKLSLFIPVKEHDKAQEIFRDALVKQIKLNELRHFVQKTLDFGDIDEAKAKQTITDAINGLLATPAANAEESRLLTKLFAASELYTNGEPSSVSGQEAYKQNLAESKAMIIQLFEAPCLTKSDGSITFEATELNERAIKYELAQHRANDLEGLNKTTGKANTERYQLTGSDLRIAIKKLMQENPTKSSQLSKVRVVETMDSLARTLAKAKEDGLPYPQQFIVHRGSAKSGHWTRLTIDNKEGQITARYNDSIAETVEGNKAATDRAAIDEALKITYPEAIYETIVNYTGKQKDGWTCGYHTLAGIAKELSIDNIPDTEALQDWLFKLVTDKSVILYKAEPLKHSSLDERRAKARSSRPVATKISSEHETVKPFEQEHKDWLQQYSKSLGYTPTFSERSQTFTMEIKSSDTDATAKPRKPAKLEVNTAEVSVKNADSLPQADKQALAENMVKLYVANELGLKGDEHLPSKKDLKDRNITIRSLSGSDEELKGFIKEQLKEYGVKFESEVNLASSSSTKSPTTSELDQSEDLGPGHAPS